jgi:excisionase family DNA binding protein
MQPKIQKFYRVAEVMQLLGVSRTTVYRWGQEGRLKIVKYGKRATGVPTDSLREFMRAGGDNEPAPDLLAILNSIVVLCETSGEPVDGFAFRERVIAARAAIAKAKGLA